MTLAPLAYFPLFLEAYRKPDIGVVPRNFTPSIQLFTFTTLSFVDERHCPLHVTWNGEGYVLIHDTVKFVSSIFINMVLNPPRIVRHAV